MSEAILAAGAVVWRPASDESDEVEVLLVHRPKYDDWSLPKGAFYVVHVTAGELAGLERYEL